MPRLTDEEILKRAEGVIARRISESPPVSGDKLTRPELTFKYVRLMYAGLDPHREHFGVVWLNTQHAIIKSDVLFSGTIDGASVWPRVIARSALLCNAAACVLVHNHPSGDMRASHSDRAITTRIRDALSLLDVRVLDHMIVPTPRLDEYYSFAEKGEI